MVKKICVTLYNMLKFSLIMKANLHNRSIPKWGEMIYTGFYMMLVGRDGHPTSLGSITSTIKFYMLTFAMKINSNIVTYFIYITFICY